MSLLHIVGCAVGGEAVRGRHGHLVLGLVPSSHASCVHPMFNYVHFPWGREDYTYIGLKRESPTSNNFKWASGLECNYTLWSPGEPNNGGGGSVKEACVQYLTLVGAHYWKWNDVSCDYKMFYICETKCNSIGYKALTID
ncbi:unnamed protein product [Heligmosomoides polygyrus]|uniref:C-type lectin domain-containing protein n=1 Tax=Heligmosomoides polygyrus TaxID=6339 RepID=A0A183G695_HELPZ|nr:unnamed protein product [Heligmosomoides polygyrus]